MDGENFMREAVRILLDTIKERGLSVRLVNGHVVLSGDTRQATPELMAALKHFRSDVIQAAGLTELAHPAEPTCDAEEDVIRPKPPLEQ
jgi:hypothetical protein